MRELGATETLGSGQSSSAPFCCQPHRSLSLWTGLSAGAGVHEYAEPVWGVVQGAV